MLDPESWEQLGKQFLFYLPRLVTALLIFIFFWLVARAVRQVVERLTRVRKLDPDLTRYLGSATRVLLLLLGALTALGTLGVDVTALVAGLGLTGFALGFALKDILSNAMSGILVLMYRPFRVGDRINVQSMEGVVMEINLRYTVLEDQGKRMLIPNANLFNNPVTVLSRASHPEEDTPEGA
jgi:small-conductance mechanosensitive channel